MQHAEVVVGFLFPANKQASKTVGPRMSSFYNPSPGLESLVAFTLFNSLTAGFEMRLIAMAIQEIANIPRVITFAEVAVLMAFRGWLQAFFRNTVKSPFNKFNVVSVGTADFNTQRDTAGISEN